MKTASHRLKKIALGLVIVTLSSGLAGCFDATEVENLNVVAGIGVDLLDNDLVKVTLEIFRPIRSGQAAGAEPNQRQSFVVMGTGQTIEDALACFNNRAPRRLYYPHNVLFIFGKKYAERGLDQAFDYLERDRAYRRNELVLISKQTASSILQSHLVTPRVTSLGLRQLIDGVSTQSEVYNSEQFNFLRQYLEPSHTSLASVICLASGLPAVSGLALLKKGVFITEFGNPEVKGLLWMLGDTKQITVTVPTGQSAGEKQKSTMNLTRTYRTIHWHKNGHRLVADITVKGRAEVVHLADTKSLTSKTIKKLEAATDQYIATKMRTSMETMQEISVDGAQLATSLHRSKPRWWKENAAQWDTVFPSIETHYHVQIHILRTGLSGKSPSGAYSTPGSLPPSE